MSGLEIQKQSLSCPTELYRAYLLKTAGTYGCKISKYVLF